MVELEGREIITVQEASALFGLDPTGYHRAIATGELKAWKVRGRGRNGQWRLIKSEVRSWILGQPSKEKKVA